MDDATKSKLEELTANRERLIQNMHAEIDSCEFALSRWLRKLHENTEEIERLTKL